MYITVSVSLSAWCSGVHPWQGVCPRWYQSVKSSAWLHRPTTGNSTFYTVLYTAQITIWPL